ncbi:MAG: glycosyltransferase family 4 protein [Desulfotomaculum sp.]|nr:glycosyltransferase family 4 protein [Desulfotomaculum sp.]
MRIGMFSDSYRPYTSGVVRSLETFKTELESMGHEIFIFAPNYPNCEREPNVYRFFSIPAPTNKNFTLALPFSIGLLSKIKKLKLDIIHVHSPFLMGRLGVRCARKLGLPLVFTYHTLYDKYVHYVPFSQNVTKELTQKFTIDFCNHCDMVIVPTNIIADRLRKSGVKVPLTAVPTGINVEEFRTADKDWLRKNYSIPGSKKIMLFVGRLGQEKNIDFLLESYIEIYKQRPDTVLVLVGSGPEEEKLKQKVKEFNLENQVIFTGTRPKEEVVKIYAGADLFVFASVTETQGLVIAEAKAAGLPVVAVDAFGVSEMVVNGEDGYLCPLDLNIFTNSVLKILNDDSLRQSMGHMALKNAEKLSSRNCANKLLRVYNKLIQTKIQHDRLHG